MSCLLLCARVQYCICVRFSLLLSFIPNLMWSFSERLVYTVRLTWSTVSFHKQRHYQIVPLLLATSPSLLIHTHVLKMWLLILFTLCAVFFFGYFKRCACILAISISTTPNSWCVVYESVLISILNLYLSSRSMRYILCECDLCDALLFASY